MLYNLLPCSPLDKRPRQIKVTLIGSKGHLETLPVFHSSASFLCSVPRKFYNHWERKNYRSCLFNYKIKLKMTAYTHIFIQSSKQ